MLPRLRHYLARTRSIIHSDGIASLIAQALRFLIRRKFLLEFPAEFVEYRLLSLRRRIPETRLSTHEGTCSKDGAKVLLYASFDPESRIRDHVIQQLSAFSDLGYKIVFITTSPLLPRSEVSRIESLCWQIVHRRNLGYDFASWRLGFESIQDRLKQVESLILMNDSCLGPEGELAPWISKASQDPQAVWGASISLELGRYIQSYFLQFSRPRIEDGTLIRYMNRIRILNTKWAVVRFLEIGGSRWLSSQGVSLRAWMDPETEPTRGLLKEFKATDPVTDPVATELFRKGLTPFYKRSNLKRRPATAQEPL